MSRYPLSRIASIAVGAAVLFGLELGLGVKFYIAVPAGVLAYTVTLVALGLMPGTDTRAK
jgi:uncharacterized membrane protein